MDIEWKAVRLGGRKVSSLEFSFSPEMQPSLFGHDGEASD
jgi:hypothetical protein